MNRRQLIQRGGLAAAFLALPSFLLTGCTESVQSILNTVISSVLAILKVTSPGAAWLAPLASALAKLQQAETQWLAGSPVQIVEDALNTISAVLGAIPLTAQYSPLIAILVAGIEAVLALIPQKAPVAAALAPNVYHGQVKLDGPGLLHPTHSGAYRAQFNAKAREIGLPQAQF